jgi:hypothetical protein
VFAKTYISYLSYLRRYLTVRIHIGSPGNTWSITWLSRKESLVKCELAARCARSVAGSHDAVCDRRPYSPTKDVDGVTAALNASFISFGCGSVLFPKHKHRNPC